MRFLLLSFIISSHLFAARLDPIIVTSKTESTSSNMTSGHTVLTSEDLDGQMTGNVIEALRSVPGVFINQTGGPGGQASIYIRGSEVRHVLVLIDGVKVNDPSTLDKQFNAANLSSLDIEKIEVIKGAQSVLYGSDAIGGVINIITKKGEPKQRVGLEIGFQTQVDGALSVVRDRSVTYVNAVAAQGDGISSKKDGAENDGFLKKGLTINHSHFLGEIEADWMFKVLDDFVEIDGFDTSLKFVDDEESYTKTNQQLFKQGLKYEDSFGTLKHILSVNRTKREFYTLDVVEDEYELTKSQGETVTNNVSLLKRLARGEYVIGFMHEYETFEQTGFDQRKINLSSLYGSVNHTLKDYFFNLGLRADNHEIFGTVATYNVGLGKKYSGRRSLKFNAATGFKAPTMYQLFVPREGVSQVANKDLQPEKSNTLDLTYSKMGKNNYEVSIFNSHIYDYINFSSDGYFNSGSFTSTGLEVSMSQKLDKLKFKEGVTVSKLSLSSDQKVLRRPQEKIDFRFDYQMSDYSSFRLDWVWIGNRFDQTDSQDIVTLDAYDLLNTSLNYSDKGVDYQLGVNNVFDREYTDIFDYGTLGLTVFAKMSHNY